MGLSLSAEQDAVGRRGDIEVGRSILRFIVIYRSASTNKIVSSMLDAIPRLTMSG